MGEALKNRSAAVAVDEEVDLDHARKVAEELGARGLYGVGNVVLDLILKVVTLELALSQGSDALERARNTIADTRRLDFILRNYRITLERKKPGDRIVSRTEIDNAIAAAETKI